MKKSLLWMLTTVFCLAFVCSAHASDDSLAFDTTPVQSAVDAFNAFSSQNNLPSAQASTSDLLDAVLSGVYNVQIKDQATAQRLAPALSKLSAITSQEVVNYANANALPLDQVRNAYYRALANVLRAEIMINPASETRYQNIQIILDLFLNGDSSDEITSETRKVIRQSMTPHHAATIAADYHLPAAFVEFVIMDDHWDNDDWTDDHHWIDEGGYAGTDDCLAKHDYAHSTHHSNDHYRDHGTDHSNDHDNGHSTDHSHASAKPAATPKPTHQTNHSTNHNSTDHGHSSGHGH